MVSNLNKGLKRSALTVALGLCFAAGVSAQSSVGSIFGDASANTAVTIENLDTGSSREITSDATGHFTFSQLAPGRYRVTSGGVAREVQVKVGTGSQVSLASAASGGATTLDTVTVVGSGAINPIDVSSVESTTVFTADQIAELPVGRDITNVALLAPGTVKGDTGFGNLASFGGSSVAENGYYVNGFDVTNIRTFLSYADLPFDAIGEQQVKTGGYGAEFGRSLGGVINIVTKRGTNEWKGGVSAYWNPQSLREHGKDVANRDAAAVAAGSPYFVYRSDNESDSWSVNLWGGGPLVKDKLFFFALIEGGQSTSDTFGRDDSNHGSNDSPSGMLKLDWNITDNHIVEFTGIYNKSKTVNTAYDNPAGQTYTGEHGIARDPIGTTNGGEIGILKYTGYLTDSFTVSAMAGYLRNINNFNDPNLLPGAECPAIYDSRAAGNPLVHVGCWNEDQFTLQDFTFKFPETDKRRAFRLDAEWRLGDHNLRFGLDKETFTSSHAGVTYSGGIYYRYFSAENVFGPDYAYLGDLVRVRKTFTQSGSYEVINQAAYLEDSWQVTDNLLIYGGIRAETFENKNALGATFIKSDELWAPRLGFSWDVHGDSTFKVFGNAGRYYIPVASNTNIRGSGYEFSSEAWYQLDGVNSDFTPQIGDVVIPEQINGSLTPPDPATVAGVGLSPMYQDEFILGMQHQLNENWQLGVRGIMREVKSGMDDYCAHNGFNAWAADEGYDPDFALDGDGIDMAGCAIINPGKDLTLAMDPDNDGDLETFTVPASYIGMPKYQRTYHALEIFWERGRANNWYMQGSYTFAKSKGNVEGYVNSTLEQVDAGATQDFDFPAFEQGAYGYLPNDRRHSLKLFGAYEWSDEWITSLNFIAQSGRPVNCNGFIPVGALGIPDPDADTISAYSGSSFYCLDPNGAITNPSNGAKYTLHNRGDMGRTPWTKTFDLSIRYTPNWANSKLQFQATVFNVLNSGTVTEYNEASQISRTSTTLSPNFLNDVNYQTPRSVRLSVRYAF